jgi:hypothetical protein
LGPQSRDPKAGIDGDVAQLFPFIRTTASRLSAGDNRNNPASLALKASAHPVDHTAVRPSESASPLGRYASRSRPWLPPITIKDCIADRSLCNLQRICSKYCLLVEVLLGSAPRMLSVPWKSKNHRSSGQNNRTAKIGVL